MEQATTKKWGSSLGLVIPIDLVKELNLIENQDVLIEIQPKTAVLKELFGFAKNKIRRPTEQIIQETRKEMGVD